jgi:hypothetical protein
VGTAGQLARASASLCIPSGSGPGRGQLPTVRVQPPRVGYGKARLKNEAAPLLPRTVASKSSTSRPRLRPDVEAGRAPPAKQEKIPPPRGHDEWSEHQCNPEVEG